MSDQGSWNALLSHPASSAGCKISRWNVAAAGCNVVAAGWNVQDPILLVFWIWLWIPKNSPQSQIALVINLLTKTPKLNTIWLELIARVLNMPIGLKVNNYYSKVFKKVNYKLWNSNFWVVITPPNRHIASPLAMKERKIKSVIIYNIMLDQKTIFKWHDDLTLTWNIKEIKLKFKQELSNKLSNHYS